MANWVIDQLEVENSVALLRAAGVDLIDFRLLDDRWRPVWADAPEDNELSPETIRRFRARDQAGAEGSSEVLEECLPNKGTALCCRIRDEQDDLVFIALLTLGNSKADHIRLCHLVCEGLRRDFLLNAELDSMADDLAARYDELNMMFAAEMARASVSFGYESLAQLVRHTGNALDVAACGLLVLRKRIQCFDPAEEEVERIWPGLLDHLRLHAALQKDPDTAVVVNSDAEQLAWSLPPSPDNKLMIAPLLAGGARIIGVLLVLNKRDGGDFENSDRNMLEVMAGRIDKALQVNFDPLTGMENAQSLEWAIRQALDNARQVEPAPVLLLVDIDRFNVINDMSGREVGDEVLVKAGRLLSDLAGPEGSAARLGGGRFGLLLENGAGQRAEVLGNTLRQLITKLDYQWQGEACALSACIGGVELNPGIRDVSEVLSMAETALRAAKTKGVNRTEVYRESNSVLTLRRGEAEWMGRIQRAIRDDHFRLYAQPIRSLKEDIQGSHHEILVRLQAEDGQILSPATFIPPAEHFFLMPELDWWVVQQSIRELSAQQHSPGGLEGSFSINLSGQTLNDPALQQKIFRALQQAGDLLGQLVFEVTESAAIESMDEARLFMRRVRDFGCRFSLDDFGSGLSSFAYLQEMELDYLKIDGSFVRRIHEDKVAATMVAAINRVGQVMGLRTIAEYVENAEIVARLNEIGVDYAQGYHFGRPIPLGEVLAGTNELETVINA